MAHGRVAGAGVSAGRYFPKVRPESAPAVIFSFLAPYYPPPRKFRRSKRAFGRVGHAGLLALCALLLIASPAIAQNQCTGKGVSISPTTLAVPAGGSATYNVKLTAPPASGPQHPNLYVVTIRISGGGSGLTFDTNPNEPGNQAALTFLPAEWNTAKTVTVSAAETAADGATATIRHESAVVTGFGDACYAIRSGIANVRACVNACPPASSEATSSGGPPAITLWTDRLAYRADEQVRVYLDIDAYEDGRRYTLFLYRESLLTGERLYLAPQTRSMALAAQVTDQYVSGSGGFWARPIEDVESELIWQGSVPHAGLWHFVAELRSPNTTQVVQRAYAKFSVPRRGSALLNRRGFERSVETDLKLTSDRFYFLGDRLRVKRGATLSIAPGTVIQASGPDAQIVIEPGARILALGRREAPVVLTCSAPLGERVPGCWGGLKVFGLAPVAASQEELAGTAADMPPDDGLEDSHDSSGVLRYVRVEFAGRGTLPEAPTAGLELHGVGDGTTLDHVQVHASLGDGIVFRGGTAHCSYCVVSDALHDSLAWERGWQGSLQHLYVQQGSEGASALHGRAHGATADDSGPLLYNATLVGGYNIGITGGAPGGLRSIGPGLLLDGEAAITARNVLATGFAGFAIDGSVASFADSRSSFSHAVLTSSGYRHTLSRPVRYQFVPYVEYINRSPQLLNIRYEPNPDPRPPSGSVALQLGNAAVPPFDSKFSRAAHYVGAFHRQNWLVEWTFFGPEQTYDVPND